MSRRSLLTVVILAAGVLGTGAARAAPAAAAPAAPAALDALTAPDDQPTLYVVGTAHLDTQWRWTIRETIDEYLPNTLRDNFALFEKYPGYVFSFEGAFRYQLMKEYYPELYARMLDYARAGRWKVTGSWIDAVDVNVPSPESLIRQTLYGNGWFRRELGQTSRDVFLPDCFGFGYALPAVAAHCGLLGFSTQKLTWGSAHGVPFGVGLWEGVNGAALVASLKPGDYVTRLKGELTADSTVVAACAAQRAASGLPVAMKYIGTGDVGGAPTDSSVMWLQRSLDGAGPVRVRSVGADQLPREVAALPEAARARLPRYKGELLMTDHGAGCYTSQAAMKRWNRRNEILGDAAERAAVTAAWLGGLDYPGDELRENWTRFLWHQFHDDLTGTSIPQAYVHSWNDEAIAENRFAAILANAVGCVTRVLDTQGEGVALVVYNPLGAWRDDVVEAEVAFPKGAPEAVRVFGPDGREVPAQLLGRRERTARVAFVANPPPVGFAVYDVRPARAGKDGAAKGGTGRGGAGQSGAAGAAGGGPNELLVSAGDVYGLPRLENDRYRVRLDAEGNVASILDKRHGRELLAAPLRLQLIDDEPQEWPAWEIDYADLMAPPRAVAGGPARVRVVEAGPARAALEVVQQAEGSTFTQTISLAAGKAGDRVEIDLAIDWRTPGTLLKAAFPLAAIADEATYDLGLGTIRRGVNTEKLYEVPAQRWADVTDGGGEFGVAVVNDSRYGWDRPDVNTLRLTLLHTPRVNANWQWVGDQRSQDLGRHRVRLAIAGHDGDWRQGDVPQLADRFNQPALAFQAPRHAGRFDVGKTFALFWLHQPVRAGDVDRGAGAQPPTAAIRAVKMAEQSAEMIVRVQELHGETIRDVALAGARPIVAVREVNGAEEPLGEAPVSGPAGGALGLRDGAVFLELRPYQVRTLAVTLAPPTGRLEPCPMAPVALPWNLDGISDDAARTDGDFDGAGHTLPSELLPADLAREGILFETGPREPGAANVVACRGQKLALPAGKWDRLYLLAAAVGGDREATFAVDGRPVALRLQDWAEPVGQWDSRLVAGELRHDPDGIVPGYVKPAPLGWVATHRHDAQGRNESYTFAHFCRHRIDLPRGARSVTLPDDPRVRILAATVAVNPNDAARPASALIETPPASSVAIRAPWRTFLGTQPVELTSPNPGAVIRYTLDGSEPTAASPVYTGPLLLDRSAILKARASVPGLDDRYVAAAEFRKVPPSPAAPRPAALAPGLACRMYEGHVDSLPDFAALAPGRVEIVPDFGLPAWAPRQYYSLVYDGWLSVPRTGVYRFSLRSDDGSALLLDGRELIDNDGLGGKGLQHAEVGLAAGLHAIQVRYFQHRGDVELRLWWEGPGLAAQPIAASALWRAGEAE